MCYSDKWKVTIGVWKGAITEKKDDNAVTQCHTRECLQYTLTTSFLPIPSFMNLTPSPMHTRLHMDLAQKWTEMEKNIWKKLDLFDWCGLLFIENSEQKIFSGFVYLFTYITWCEQNPYALIWCG